MSRARNGSNPGLQDFFSSDDENVKSAASIDSFSASEDSNEDDPSTYIRADGFRPKDILYIDAYMQQQRTNYIAAGDYKFEYEGRQQTCSLRAPVRSIGSLQDIIENDELDDFELQYLLQPAYVNKYFAPGTHILLIRDEDGTIIEGRKFTTSEGLFVREDKYRNIVCDVIDTQCLLGSGSFGAVYPIKGSLKFRYFDKPGMRYEPGQNRRVAKLLYDKKFQNAVFIKKVVNEVACSPANLAMRYPLFGTYSISDSTRVAGLSMRYLRGKELHELIWQDLQNNDVDFGEKLLIIIALFEAVENYHKEGKVHRDLKPENIFLYQCGPFYFLNIIDGGLACLAGTNPIEHRVGTIAYASPEAFYEGEIQDASGDTYTAGMIAALLLHHPRVVNFFNNADSDSKCWKARCDDHLVIPADELVLPPECEMLRGLFARILHVDKTQRPNDSECVNAARKAYASYIKAKKDSSDWLEVFAAINYARMAKRIFHDYEGRVFSNLCAYNIRREIDEIIDNMTPTTLSCKEFIREFGKKCLMYSITPDLLKRKIAWIMDEFFEAKNQMLLMRAEMMSTVDKMMLTGMDEDDANVVKLTREINNLNLFFHEIEKTPVDLDRIFEATVHMHSKYAKMLRVKQCFENIFHQQRNKI